MSASETMTVPASNSNSSRIERLSAWLERAGEWLNPLLVKECRQAMKSRQFMYTFAAVLLLCWGWSILGLSQLGAIGNEQRSIRLFMGYYVILAAPLMIIVPFTAFRSLIAEREDNTYELVAITSLRPRQIVGGKLGSAVSQMLVYLSAAAPCLAFTYLLRGIDLPTIGLVLFYTIAGSLGLSMVTLFLATLAVDRVWQVLLTVGIAISLFYAFLGACAAAHDLLRHPPWNDREFWLLNFGGVLFYLSTFALIYLAAGARLTFTAENRSTPLRVGMLVQQALFVGWIGLVVFTELERFGAPSRRFFFSILLAIPLPTAAFYWYAMGALMSGENVELSRRVKRTLPRSLLGRAFLTWLGPGPGTGYVFAIANLATVTLLTWILAVSFLDIPPPQHSQALSAMTRLCIAVVAYVAAYLGAGNLLLYLIRMVSSVTIFTASVIQCLLVLIGIAGPYLIAEMNRVHVHSYSLLHVTNPLWSCVELLESRSGTSADMIVWLVAPAGLILFLINLWIVAPRVREQTADKPLRMIEEDAASAPPAPAAVPASPWD